MTWEKTIKKYKPMSPKRDLRGKGLDNPNLKQRSKEALHAQEGGYNKPPQDVTFKEDCKVRKCAAQLCKNNYRHKCTLKEITISQDGRCREFEEDRNHNYKVSPIDTRKEKPKFKEYDPEW